MDNSGNVRSLYKTKTGFRKCFPDKDGYLKLVAKGVDGKTYNAFIHRLVYLVWIGEIPEGMSIDHVDGNKLNNHHSNFQLLTMGENAAKGNSKSWQLLSPEGKRFMIYNMNSFCKENNLNPNRMRDVAKGKPSYLQHKGWRKYHD